jgi:hypothetical protein
MFSFFLFRGHSMPMKTKRTARRLWLVALPLGLSLVSLGVQASCTTAAQQYLQQAMQNQQAINNAGQQQAIKLMNQPLPTNSGAGFNMCASSNWSTVFPSATSILSGVGSQIAQQLCSQARSQLASAMPSYLQTFTNPMIMSGNLPSASSYGGVAASQVGSALSSSGVNGGVSGAVSQGVSQGVTQTVKSTTTPTQTGSPLSGLFGGGQ